MKIFLLGKYRSMQILLTATLSCGALLQAQGLSSTPAKTPSVLVNPSHMPSLARAFLFSMGDRLVKPGNERTILTGTYRDLAGTAQAQVAWEAPGRIRFDRSNKPNAPLIADGVSGLLSASSFSQSETDELESLLDDGVESFLYGFSTSTTTHRFIGGHFRSDDGSTKNFQGPWYDIYQAVAVVKAQPNKPTRQKFYYFDSQTQLLTKTDYVLPGGTKISTQFTWRKRGNQFLLDTVTRTQSGTSVFTFNVSQAASGAAVSDGLFPTTK